jgi:GNAT superfamily N-acetyltransferase
VHNLVGIFFKHPRTLNFINPSKSWTFKFALQLKNRLSIHHRTIKRHLRRTRLFLQWLDEPNRRVIVAEKGGAVIGLRAFHIVDGGNTVVSQSLRVHLKYRGQGISTVLILIAEQRYVQTHFPSVITERYYYTTMSTNVNRLAIQKKSAGENLVLNHRILC